MTECKRFEHKQKFLVAIAELEDKFYSKVTYDWCCFDVLAPYSPFLYGVYYCFLNGVFYS